MTFDQVGEGGGVGTPDRLKACAERCLGREIDADGPGLDHEQVIGVDQLLRRSACKARIVPQSLGERQSRTAEEAAGIHHAARATEIVARQRVEHLLLGRH